MYLDKIKLNILIFPLLCLQPSQPVPMFLNAIFPFFLLKFIYQYKGKTRTNKRMDAGTSSASRWYKQSDSTAKNNRWVCTFTQVFSIRFFFYRSHNFRPLTKYVTLNSKQSLNFATYNFLNFVGNKRIEVSANVEFCYAKLELNAPLSYLIQGQGNQSNRKIRRWFLWSKRFLWYHWCASWAWRTTCKVLQSWRGNYILVWILDNRQCHTGLFETRWCHILR